MRYAQGSNCPRSDQRMRAILFYFTYIFSKWNCSLWEWVVCTKYEEGEKHLRNSTPSSQTELDKRARTLLIFFKRDLVSSIFSLVCIYKRLRTQKVLPFPYNIKKIDSEKSEMLPKAISQGIIRLYFTPRLDLVIFQVFSILLSRSAHLAPGKLIWTLDWAGDIFNPDLNTFLKPKHYLACFLQYIIPFDNNNNSTFVLF